MMPADASKPNGETYVIVPAALLAAHSDALTSAADDPAWGDEPAADEPPDELPQAAAVRTTATRAQPFIAPFPALHLRFTPTSSSLCAPRVGVHHFVSAAELCQTSSRRCISTTRTNRAMPMTARTTTDA